MKGRSLKSLADFSREEIATLLRMSTALKLKMKTRGEIYRPLVRRGPTMANPRTSSSFVANARRPHPPGALALAMQVGKTMAMIFQKRSTRTRVSTETGIARLGGHALFLGAEDIQLGVNETARDTARVLARYNDVILARVYGHNLIEELAQEAHVPIINALSDKFHPLQMLADMQTLEEHYGRLAGLNVAWVGDGNNILNSFLEAAPKVRASRRSLGPRFFDSLLQCRRRLSSYDRSDSLTMFLLSLGTDACVCLCVCRCVADGVPPERGDAEGLRRAVGRGGGGEEGRADGGDAADVHAPA